MRKRRAAAGALVACALLAADCSSDGTSTQTTSVTYQHIWKEGPCVVDVPAGAKVTCGTLTVPEDRTKPNGNKVVLPIVRIHSTAANPDPDPVVYLHGGPGIGTLHNGIAARLSNPALAHRDLILFDQRGTGLAKPSLECPERETAFLQALSQAAPFKDELKLFDTALATCYKRLRSAGYDLDQYNSQTNADDLEDLRVSLGIKSWNLWGVSYGTRLALTEMRSHPDGIRSVVLDSVYPPSAGAVDAQVTSGQRAFDALANGCGTDPSCDVRYPDLRTDLQKLTKDLDAAPYTFDYRDPDGKTTTLRLTGTDAAGGVFIALYQTDLIPQLPAAINDLANGGRQLVPLLASMGVPFVNDTTEGAFLSYECADNGARINHAEVKKLRNDPGIAALPLLVSWNLFCDQWPVKHLPASYGDVVTSKIPTLVIAGEYDPITPPATSKAVADALSSSVFIEVPHGGHGPGPSNPCSLGVYSQFFDDLTKVDTSCVAKIVPAPFT